MHFLYEVSFQDVMHINDLLLSGNTWVALGILSSCVARRPFYFTRTILLFSSFLLFMVGLDKIIIVSMWGHYGSKILGVFLKAP
jgi:hypothetical protein